MYHTINKIGYSYIMGLTSGISIYSFLIYCDLEKQMYWDRFFNGKIISLSLGAFTWGCYLGFFSKSDCKCLIPYQYFKH